jgi:guanine deaminase
MPTRAPDRAADADWLAQAVRLATANVDNGGGPFGAVVVRDGEVIGTGTNRVTVDQDPTAHAEIVAIRAACRRIDDFSLTGCLLVASCEPCPLCFSAALWARVDRVLYAADRDDAAAAGFDDREFHGLMAKPRSSWPLSVAQLSTEDRNSPFSAWMSRSDRVEY